MKRLLSHATICAFLTCCAVVASLAGCAGSSGAGSPAGEVPSEEQQVVGDVLADGTYQIEVDTDSSMFRGETCVLTVADGTYTAALSLPGKGFSRLYFGTAEEAQQAADEDIYDYYLNDEGLYTFDVPVAALDEELTIAAFGHRRDTWYDHTITFRSPTEAEQADAA